MKQIVDNYYEKNMKDFFIIGMHWRGTNKWSEVKLIDPTAVLEKAISISKTVKKPFKYFVASDEMNFIKLAQQKLRDAPVIFYEQAERSSNHNVAFYMDPSTTASPSKRGLDVLVEALLLSKSNVLIHTVSNVSTGALFFNPDLIDIVLFEA